MIKKRKLHGVMELSRDISYTGSIMLTKHSPLTRIFTRGDLVSLHMLQVTLLLSLSLRLFKVAVAPAVNCIDFVAIVFATIVVVVLLLLLLLFLLVCCCCCYACSCCS